MESVQEVNLVSASQKRQIAQQKTVEWSKIIKPVEDHLRNEMKDVQGADNYHRQMMNILDRDIKRTIEFRHKIIQARRNKRESQAQRKSQSQKSNKQRIPRPLEDEISDGDNPNSLMQKAEVAVKIESKQQSNTSADNVLEAKSSTQYFQSDKIKIDPEINQIDRPELTEMESFEQSNLSLAEVSKAYKDVSDQRVKEQSARYLYETVIDKTKTNKNDHFYRVFQKLSTIKSPWIMPFLIANHSDTSMKVFSLAGKSFKNLPTFENSAAFKNTSPFTQLWMKCQKMVTLFENGMAYTDPQPANEVEYGCVMKQIDFGDMYLLIDFLLNKPGQDQITLDQKLRDSIHHALECATPRFQEICLKKSNRKDLIRVFGRHNKQLLADRRTLFSKGNNQQRKEIIDQMVKAISLFIGKYSQENFFKYIVSYWHWVSLENKQEQLKEPIEAIKKEIKLTKQSEQYKDLSHEASLQTLKQFQAKVEEHIKMTDGIPDELLQWEHYDYLEPGEVKRVTEMMEYLQQNRSTVTSHYVRVDRDKARALVLRDADDEVTLTDVVEALHCDSGQGLICVTVFLQNMVYIMWDLSLVDCQWTGLRQLVRPEEAKGDKVHDVMLRKCGPHGHRLGSVVHLKRTEGDQSKVRAKFMQDLVVLVEGLKCREEYESIRKGLVSCLQAESNEQVIDGLLELENQLAPKKLKDQSKIQS